MGRQSADSDDDGAGGSSPAPLDEGPSLERLLLRHTPAAIAMFDREMRYLEVSNRWLTDYHLEGQELVGRSHYEVFPDVPERWKEIHRRAMGGAVVRCDEDPFERADGTTEWLEWEVRPWRAANGEVGGIIMLTQVITKRKRAEAERDELTHALAERVKELTLLHQAARLLHGERALDEALLRGLVELLPAAWQYPEVCEARITYANLEARTRGFRAAPWAQSCSFATRHGQTGKVEVVYLEQRPEATEGPFLAEERSLVQSLAEMLRTHIERKHAELALRKTEAKFASIFERAPVGIIITQVSDGRILEANHEFERLLGYTREEAVGLTTLELGVWADARRREEVVALARKQGDTLGFELEVRAKDGRLLVLNVSAQFFELDGESVLLTVFLDLSQQKQAEAAIRASEARLRRVIASPILGFAFGRGDGTIHEANDEYLRIIGYGRDELLAGHINFLSLTPREDQESNEMALGQIAATETSKPWEMELARKDGSRVRVLLGVSSIDDSGDEAVAFVFDLTERRALERQLQQSQKMEAVGRLAAGIAHDFNNVLSSITISSDLLREEFPPDHPAVEYALEMRGAAERASALTRQLLAFSRQQVLEPRVLALNDLFRQLERLLRRVLRDDIVLETRYAPGLGAVRADPSQLQQVLLNLVVNARDAMPKGGRITIETANLEHASQASLGAQALPAGSYVVLSVADTGVGMDAQTKLRLFEPFFTTKEPGKGTGLGLPTVLGIVQQSGGVIDVESEPGQGSCFRVLLPRVHQAIDPAPAAASRRTEGGKETILLVEDDAAVRRMTRKVLARLGYRIIEASTPSEARERAGAFAGPIDLLLSDVLMREMSGRALAGELVTKRPGLRVLLMSGFTDDDVVRRGSMPPGYSFIQKPFTSDELAARLRVVLDPR